MLNWQKIQASKWIKGVQKVRGKKCPMEVVDESVL